MDSHWLCLKCCISVRFIRARVLAHTLGGYLWTSFSNICPHACLQLLTFHETVICQDSTSYSFCAQLKSAQGQPSHHLSFLTALLWGFCENAVSVFFSAHFSFFKKWSTLKLFLKCWTISVLSGSWCVWRLFWSAHLLLVSEQQLWDHPELHYHTVIQNRSISMDLLGAQSLCFQGSFTRAQCYPD